MDKQMWYTHKNECNMESESESEVVSDSLRPCGL